jgi:formate dehydrogenase (coenzyme F420) beta subunit
MADAIKIEVKEQDTVRSLQAFLKALLEKGAISALLVAQHLPGGGAVMPTLVTDPNRLDGADPLAPVFPINAAKVVSKLTRKPIGGRIGVVLRPCEIRAFTELVKLKQGSVEELVLIGMDCLGAFRNQDYRQFSKKGGMESTRLFLERVATGNLNATNGASLSPACLACEHPTPQGSDCTIGLLGLDPTRELVVLAHSEKGRILLDSLGLPAASEPPERNKSVDELVSARSAYRDTMLRETAEATSDMGKLVEYLSDCVNCYNCRVACPVCYCKECVFVTDVFDHEPSQYLRWAKRKGVIKMPTDTVFYHLTRLAHMSTACVGCGQCSNACPNDVPVVELFKAISRHTQAAFNYEAGRSLDEAPPLSAFREKEFSEVTGGHD